MVKACKIGKVKSNKFQKLLFSNMFKTYEILNVSKECFDASPTVESAGFMDGVKIKDKTHSDFLIRELKKKGFKESKG